ncbi:MAG: hypothetical protein UT29_C0003G0049 [Candidatus Yanofskybacteria bacterium GW2011_GWA1_39_13]|uniref:Glutamyl-tRNA amidotransferase n=1 Tax=Yanofskybacteria sp. (strain GW2011_GWA1_39_13) TaxID=1619019 RepID=A0A0G0MGT8_YANXG|nr:MAG: hypothetical protein UT29_C0003G0049 [Candidatus Yanofskybacteria bacterium GW2011_GWA1_39_13]
MNIKDKLQGEVKEALKSGDSKKRTLLGMVLSSIKNRELEKRGKIIKTEPDMAKDEAEEQSKLNDEEVIEVLSSEIKKRKDAVEQFEKGGRPELAEGERKEAEMLMTYMPEQMSEDEIRTEVRKTIDETGAKDVKEMGKVIGAIMAKIKGKADGQTVSRLVKEELSK